MKPVVKIHRQEMNESGTISKIIIDDKTFYGLEQPWRNNAANQSCIPTGVYCLVPHSSDRFGDTWAFVGGQVSQYKNEATERFACIIHVGNYVSDVKGCVALGTDWTRTPEGNLMVTNSKVAMEQLRGILQRDEWYEAYITAF